MFAVALVALLASAQGERRRSQRPKDKAADEAELLELFKRLDKVRAELVGRVAWGKRPPTLTPSWTPRYSPSRTRTYPRSSSTRRWWCRRCG